MVKTEKEKENKNTQTNKQTKKAKVERGKQIIREYERRANLVKDALAWWRAI